MAKPLGGLEGTNFFIFNIVIFFTFLLNLTPYFLLFTFILKSLLPFLVHPNLKKAVLPLIGGMPFTPTSLRM